MRINRRGLEPLALGAQDPGSAPPRLRDRYAGIAELWEAPDYFWDEVPDEPIPEEPIDDPRTARPPGNTEPR
jgi:hypothetical protein